MNLNEYINIKNFLNISSSNCTDAMKTLMLPITTYFDGVVYD